MRIACLLFGMLILFSCRQEGKRIPENFIVPEEQSPALPAIDADRKIYRGLFVAGKRMKSFKRCESPDVKYYVIDSTFQMDELYQTIFLNSPAFPYEYVYTEVRGEVVAAPEPAALQGFDSALVVYETLTFEQKNYRNTCIPYDFWALGTTPSWSLQVSAKEGILALKDYDNNMVYLFEYFAPKVVNDEVFTYYSNNYANQTAIIAIFKKASCSESPTDNAYSYTATIVVNGKRYSGCAIRKSEENQ
ncbi:MAG: hypothetical protein IPG01_11970 [Chitinophagaceae bacterium]|nr:hypothetical protein [Chitinophagaceae bacterium]